MQAAPVEKATPPKEDVFSKRRAEGKVEGDPKSIKVATTKDRSRNLKDGFPDPKDRAAFLKKLGLPDELTPRASSPAGSAATP